jgi:quercetin dioxygenase-like cupin family protein
MMPSQAIARLSMELIWRKDRAHVGDELRNILTKIQGIILRKTGKETDGALLEMKAYYKPGSHYPPVHYHPLQDEHFQVIKGRVSVRSNAVEQTYEAGQSFDIPRGTPHTFRNGGDQEAGVIWQIRPALKTQQFYETLWGLASDGKPTGKVFQTFCSYPSCRKTTPTSSC